MSHTTSNMSRPPGLRRAGAALAAVLLTLGAGYILVAPAQAASGVIRSPAPTPA